MQAAPNAKLLRAAEQGNEQAITEAIAEGADVHFLHPALNMTALHQAAKTGIARAVELLVRANANVNAVNSVNVAPLHYAAQSGHVDVVKVLLTLGARKDVITKVREGARERVSQP